jgi:uncharacterized coiled-coil DUF342 family protein
MEEQKQVVDVSTSAVKKAVRSEALQSPTTLYTTVLGVVGLSGGLVMTSPMLAIIGGGFLIFGLGKGIVDQTFLQSVYEKKYLRDVREKQRKYLDELPGRLSKMFEESGESQGLKQLTELEASFEDFNVLLEKKFSAKGLTLGRFQTVSQQVRGVALEKLLMIVDLSKAIESIPAGLVRELEKLDKNDKSRNEIQERVNQRNEVLETISTLHRDVESCLTRISDISIQLAKVGQDEELNYKFEGLIDVLRNLSTQTKSLKKEN